MSIFKNLPAPKSVLSFVVHNPWKIIVAISLITLFFAIQIPKLRFETSIYDLVIEDLPKTAEYEAFKKEFGCEEIILVVARTQDVFQPDTFGKIRNLADALSKIGGIRRVISLPDIRKAMDVTEKWTLEDFKKIISPITLFERNIVSADGKTCVISLILEDIREKDRVISEVQTLIDKQKHSGDIYQIGMPIVSKALGDFTESDFMSLPVITFSVILLMLFVFFRNIRGILIPTGSVLIGLIWTFGLMGLTRTPLSLLTMIVPIFLIAVGTAYCMYIFPQYAFAVDETSGPKEAAIATFERTGFPTSLAVITTIIGLGSLLINKIHDVRVFALFSCVGILFMLVIILTLLPAVLGMLPVPKETSPRVSTHPRVMDRILNAIVHINLRHQKISLPIIALIGLFGIVGMTRIEVETNPVDFFKNTTSVARHFRDISRDMAGSFPINVVIDSGKDGYFEEPAHLKEIDRIQVFLNSLKGVDKTISFNDYLKLVNYATNQYKASLYALPEAGFEVRMLVNSFKTLLGQDMLERFMSPDFSKTNIVLRTHLASSKDFLAIQDKIENHLRKAFPGNFAFQVTGIGVVISQSSQLITEGQIKSLGLTLLLVFAIMFLLFMSYKVGIIGILPNCFPIVVSFGVMGWAGIPLSMATSLIATIAIGLAVDDTIHYLVGYNREFKKDLDREEALRKTVRHIGRPIIFTTLTISIGFSVLMGSSFKPTAVFGLMMVITMFSALTADLILLPALMLHVELVTIWDLLRLKLGKDPHKRIPLFNGLSRSQIHYVIMAGALKTHEQGAVVFSKGEISDSMYVVISGELQVVDSPGGASSQKNEGFTHVIATLKTGDVVGEMGMIRSCERSATVVASQTTELLQINEQMVKRLQWLYPPTAHRFFFNLMTVLCDRIEASTTALLDQTISDVRSGLRNRDYFKTVLKNELELTQPVGGKAPLSFFVLMIEDLPRITLCDGDEITDTILKETGKVLKEKVKNADYVCRFDSNQFAGMLPGIPLKDAVVFCEDLRSVIENRPYGGDSGALRIHLQYGVSSTEEAGIDDTRSLIEAAFASLRAACET